MFSSSSLLFLRENRCSEEEEEDLMTLPPQNMQPGVLKKYFVEKGGADAGVRELLVGEKKTFLR